MLLFDLEKAFGCLRDAKLAGSNGLKLIVEDFHRGTSYLLLGARQGSDEGPVVFLALYKAIMDEVKDTRGSVGTPRSLGM